MIFNYIVEEVHKTVVLEEEGVVVILVEVEEIREEVEGVLLGEEELSVWQEMELIIPQVKVDLDLWEELQEAEQEVKLVCSKANFIFIFMYVKYQILIDSTQKESFLSFKIDVEKVVNINLLFE